MEREVFNSLLFEDRVIWYNNRKKRLSVNLILATGVFVIGMLFLFLRFFFPIFNVLPMPREIRIGFLIFLLIGIIWFIVVLYLKVIHNRRFFIFEHNNSEVIFWKHSVLDTIIFCKKYKDDKALIFSLLDALVNEVLKKDSWSYYNDASDFTPVSALAEELTKSIPGFIHEEKLIKYYSFHYMIYQIKLSGFSIDLIKNYIDNQGTVNRSIILSRKILTEYYNNSEIRVKGIDVLETILNKHPGIICAVLKSDFIILDDSLRKFLKEKFPDRFL